MPSRNDTLAKTQTGELTAAASARGTRASGVSKTDQRWDRVLPPRSPAGVSANFGAGCLQPGSPRRSVITTPGGDWMVVRGGKLASAARH